MNGVVIRAVLVLTELLSTQIARPDSFTYQTINIYFEDLHSLQLLTVGVHIFD